jgi:four helix bundle suffix protein
VAAWVKETCDKAGSGHRGQNGQDRLKAPSTGSTSSTKSNYSEFAANAALVLIAVANSLLDRQLAAQASVFEQEGGFTERLYRQRQLKRKSGSGQK